MYIINVLFYKLLHYFVDTNNKKHNDEKIKNLFATNVLHFKLSRTKMHYDKDMYIINVLFYKLLHYFVDTNNKKHNDEKIKNLFATNVLHFKLSRTKMHDNNT